MLDGFRMFMEAGEGRIENLFSQNTFGRHNDFATSKFLSSTWTGTEDLGVYTHGIPGVDLEMPSTSRTSKVRSVEKRKNPIRVELMDGTVLNLTLDEFNRVNSRTSLQPGRELTVVFQRLEGDSSRNPSKVIEIR